MQVCENNMQMTLKKYLKQYMAEINFISEDKQIIR